MSPPYQLGPPWERARRSELSARARRFASMLGALSAAVHGGPSHAACDDATYTGRCEESSVVWCDSGETRVAHCGAQGLACGWNADEGVWDCVLPGAPPPPCGAVGVSGRCASDTLLYCSDGGLVAVDCATVGAGCGLDASGTQFGCVTPPGQACGEVTQAGSCEEGQVTWCDDGVVRTVDCLAAGGTCVWRSAEGIADCDLPATSGCGAAGASTRTPPPVPPALWAVVSVLAGLAWARRGRRRRAKPPVR